MRELANAQAPAHNETETEHWSGFYRIGAIAALLQLAAIVGYGLMQALLGPRPTSAAEFFAIQQNSPLESLLRSDFLLLILIGAYLGTAPALFLALRRINLVATTFATLFTVAAVIGALTTEASFGLLHLGEQYAAASSDAQRAQFLAAGEALLAAGLWNSTAAYLGGILLQGAGVIISLVMLRSRDFSKITAVCGLLGNAIDLTQHTIHPFAPAISAILSAIMGLFYIIWFPMLAYDLFRLSGRRVGSTSSNAAARAIS